MRKKKKSELDWVWKYFRIPTEEEKEESDRFMKKVERREPRFEQLAKEIVAYVQINKDDTKNCIEFVEYELYLRCISKDFLTDLSKQNDDEVIV